MYKIMCSFNQESYWIKLDDYFFQVTLFCNLW